MIAAPSLEVFPLRLRLRFIPSKLFNNHIFIIFWPFGSYLFTTQKKISVKLLTSGAFYSYNGVKIAQGKEKLRIFLKENPEIKAEIEQKIRDAAKGVKTDGEEME